LSPRHLLATIAAQHPLRQCLWRLWRCQFSSYPNPAEQSSSRLLTSHLQCMAHSWPGVHSSIFPLSLSPLHPAQALLPPSGAQFCSGPSCFVLSAGTVPWPPHTPSCVYQCLTTHHLRCHVSPVLSA
jgi:hypothetical protein